MHIRFRPPRQVGPLVVLAAAVLVFACIPAASAAPGAPASALGERVVAVVDPASPLDGASVELSPGALPRDTEVTIAPAGDAALPLFPDVTVMRVSPAATLATTARIRVPYTKAMLSAWNVVDERELLLYGVDAAGVWAVVPARIDPVQHVAIADVTRLGTWAVMPGGLLTAWQQRALVGSGFVAGQRNLLVLHGWNASPWDGCMLALAAAMSPLYDHVLAYAYPSALDIGNNARWLRDAITRDAPGTTFDAIGFSEGGLIARAAIEPGAWNGGVTLASQMRSLVTIATPHDGLLADASQSLLADEASLQMRAGSSLLTALNAQPLQGGTRYYAIAGSAGPAGASDSLVPVASALAHGLPLALAGTATLPLLHAPSTGGTVAGMPCDPSVYEVLRDWLSTAR